MWRRLSRPWRRYRRRRRLAPAQETFSTRRPALDQETVTSARSGDGDLGTRAIARDVDAHVLSDPDSLFDEGLHDLRLGHRLDDLALDEDLALAVTGGDAEIGLARLSRAVHDAAHHRDPQREREVLQRRGHLVGQGVDVDLGAPA